MTKTNPEIAPPQRGLVYLRSQGETHWAPHAGVTWLRETPAGLELDLDDALREGTRQNRPGLVLLGHPGGGKTHALKRMASLCREGHARRLGLAPETRPSHIDLERWRPGDGPPGSGFEERSKAETAAGNRETASSGLLLVDGLDRLDLRHRRAAARWLRDAATRPGRRLVVTCRFAGYEPGSELGEAFLEVQLRPRAPTAATRAPESPTSIAGPAEDPGTELPAGSIRARRGGYVLTAIPGGRFRMGSPADEPGRWQDEGPRRRVDIASFYLGPKPVTHRELGLFLRARPSEAPPDDQYDPRFNHGSQPAVGVSWDLARRYATWAGLRLPTEAEWEYACRAGTSAVRYGDLDAIAWHAGNSGGNLHPVATRAANPWGLFDMLGNVWEWVEDDHHPSYQGAPADGGAWIDEPRGSNRLLRGGSWADNPRTVRAATRLTNHPGPRVGNVGFRLAADPRPPRGKD